VWKNASGVTGSVRTHLREKHESIYWNTVRTLGLKYADTGASGNQSAKEEYSAEEWVRLLMRWVVVDDQVCISCLFYSASDFHITSQSMLSTAKNFVTSYSLVENPALMAIFHIERPLQTLLPRNLQRNTRRSLMIYKRFVLLQIALFFLLTL
jgi:hypothetical protein